MAAQFRISALQWSVPAALAWLIVLVGAIDGVSSIIFGDQPCPVECVCETVDELMTTNCADQNLTTIPASVADATWILNLSGNRIQWIDEDFFDSLQSSLIDFIDLSNNRIHFIDPKAFKYFRNLLSLDLSSNLIGALPEGVLAPMISLQQLDLSYNQLDLLGERPFQGLPNLLRLRMNNNKLKKVWSDLFEGLSRLLVLHLEGNEINTIEKDSFIHLHMMEDLNLASNYLSDSAFLSNAFRRPNKIKRLLLSKNELLTIANTSFFYFPYLERLDLSYNNISYIDPDALMIQDRLYYVFLSNNPLRVIKKGLFGPLSGSIKLLDFVEASLNKIEPGAFAYLTGVQELSLSHNYDLTYLDDDLFLAMTSLEKLVINNVQQLKKLPRFRHHDHLTGIAAHITGFEVLQDDFCEHVPNLLDLDLGYGNLRSIPSFSNCTKLRQIHLRDNRLTTLEGKLINLSKLFDISLDNNRLKELTDESFEGLVSLEKLYLADNPISKISSGAFSHCRSLTHLDLNNSEFPTLPLDGLSNLRKLIVKGNKVMKKFSANESDLPAVEELVLHFAYHCCPWLKFDLHPSATPTAPSYLPVVPAPIAGKGKDGFAPDDASGGASGDTSYEDDDDDLRGPDLLNNVSIPNMSAEAWKKFQQNSSARFPVVRKVRHVKCSPQPNPMTPCSDLFPEWWMRLFVWLYIVVILSANTIVFIVIVASRPKYETRTSSFFIMFLSLADFLMGVYLLILAVVDLTTTSEYSEHALDWQVSSGCNAAGFFAVFSSMLAVFTLTIITIDRFISMRFTMGGKWRLNLQKARVSVILGVIFALVVAVLPLTGVSSYNEVGICLPFSVESHKDLGFITFLLVIRLVSLLIIGLAYYLIYKKYTESQSVWNPKEKKVAIRMTFLVVSNCICWVPISVLGLLVLYGPRDEIVSLSPEGSGKISLFAAKILVIFFFPFNAALDPFLYAINTPHFRRDLKHWVKKVRTKMQMLSFGRGLTGSSVRRPSVSSGHRHVNAAAAATASAAAEAKRLAKRRIKIDIQLEGCNSSPSQSCQDQHQSIEAEDNELQKAHAFRRWQMRRPSCMTNATFIQNTNSFAGTSTPTQVHGDQAANYSTSSNSNYARGAVSDTSSTGTFHHVCVTTKADMHQREMTPKPVPRATVVRFNNPNPDPCGISMETSV
eukprot:m.142458 g.142458  ORF g.142458 m.142458 type:complete len:1171 (+) comp38361_c0_seq16:45-3557(+)